MIAVSVLPIGTPVRIGKDVRAIVTEICIRGGDSVQYQCAWWDGLERKTEWLDQNEVSPDWDVDAKQVLIGFQTPPGED